MGNMWRAFCDGSCLVHTGKCGGVGVLVYPPAAKEPQVSSFHVCKTTAQVMELEAVAEALDMTPPGATVLITTDSQYAYHVLEGDWKLTANLDIIERIQRLAEKRRVLPVWVPRNSEPEMKQADTLSKHAAKACPVWVEQVAKLIVALHREAFVALARL